MSYPHPFAYFHEEDVCAIAEAISYEQLRDVALRVLLRMPIGVSMVCGPISTGGLGSIEKNLERFNYAINLLFSSGVNVFTQIPFEGAIKRIRGNAPPYHDGFQLLEVFYLPIFSSGRVARLCFLPDWQTSVGTRWEHDQAVALSLERKYFRHDLESCIAVDIIS